MQPSGAMHNVGLIIPQGCSSSPTCCSISLSFVKLAFNVPSALKWLLGSAAFCLGKQKEECEKKLGKYLGACVITSMPLCLALDMASIIPFAALQFISQSKMLENFLT